MAVYLVSLGDPLERVGLRPGTWWLSLQDGTPRLAAEVGQAGSPARLEVAATGITIVPLEAGRIEINGVAAETATPLRPGDAVAIDGTAFSLVAEAASRSVTPDDVSVALPPPDPPAWRTILGVVAAVAVAGVVALVIRLVPRPAPDPIELMPEAVRRQVTAASVWVRARVGDAESEGSGYVSRPGHVITNAHVVLGATAVEVVFDAGEARVRRRTAQVLRAGDPGTPRDLAVLKVDTGSAPALGLADLDDLVPGTPLACFGFPLGSALSTSHNGPRISIRGGRLTALRTDDRGRVVWVESDIAAEVGNSGGPVVTHEGKVVGLGTMLVGPHLKTFLAAPANLIREFEPAT